MWWVKGGGGRGGRGNVRERDAGKEKNNEAKSAGSINRHDDWSDSDWVEEEGKTRREKPKLVEFIFIQTPLQHLSPYKLPIHPECLLAPSSSTTPSYPPLTLAPPPYFPSPPPFPPSPCSITPPPPPSLFGFGQTWTPPHPPPHHPLSPSQLWITWRPGTQRLPGPPDDSQPGHNKWLTALFT